MPSLCSGSPKETPGMPFSTTKSVRPLVPGLAIGDGRADVGVGHAAVGEEDLGAVEHVVVAVAHGGGLDRRRRPSRLRARSWPARPASRPLASGVRNRCFCSSFPNSRIGSAQSEMFTSMIRPVVAQALHSSSTIMAKST